MDPATRASGEGEISYGAKLSDKPKPSETDRKCGSVCKDALSYLGRCLLLASFGATAYFFPKATIITVLASTGLGICCGVIFICLVAMGGQSRSAEMVSEPASK